MQHVTKACAMHATTDLKHKGVGGDADVESVGLAPSMALGLALLGAAKVGEQLEGWAPLLALHLPVQHDRCGDHNQVGTPITPAQIRSLQHDRCGYHNQVRTPITPAQAGSLQHDRCGDHKQVGTPITPAHTEQVSSAYLKQEQRPQGRGGVGVKLSRSQETVFLTMVMMLLVNGFDSMHTEVPDQQAKTTSSASILFTVLPRSL